MQTRLETVIDYDEWNKVVEATYGKPYNLQQQCGCRGRGMIRFKVPDESFDDDMNDSVPEVVNHNDMGVKFEAWKNRDPKAPLLSGDEELRTEPYAIQLWWHRNFYPDFQTVANDLHARGLLEAGEYTISIDW